MLVEDSMSHLQKLYMLVQWVRIQCHIYMLGEDSMSHLHAGCGFNVIFTCWVMIQCHIYMLGNDSMSYLHAE